MTLLSDEELNESDELLKNVSVNSLGDNLKGPKDQVDLPAGSMATQPIIP